MISKFKNIDYLKCGNRKQKTAHKVLSELNIFKILSSFNPILVGTIPIEIDIVGSDLDIACEVYDFDHFLIFIDDYFASFDDYKSRFDSDCENQFAVANFMFKDFEIEIYARSVATEKQNGYRHMILEDRILKLAGEDFKKDIIKLKNTGMKTEASFAKLLNLYGDPFEELLKLEELSDEEIINLL